MTSSRCASAIASARRSTEGSRVVAWDWLSYPPAFIGKGWTNYELDGIVTRTVSGEQILLPIWHNITKQQVIDFSPSLADKVARSTATHTVAEIAEEIAQLIRGELE